MHTLLTAYIDSIVMDDRQVPAAGQTRIVNQPHSAEVPPNSLHTSLPGPLFLLFCKVMKRHKV